MIETEAAYRKILQEIETLMLAQADTPEGEQLLALVTAVEQYEKNHYSMY